MAAQTREANKANQHNIVSALILRKISGSVMHLIGKRATQIPELLIVTNKTSGDQSFSQAGFGCAAT